MISHDFEYKLQKVGINHPALSIEKFQQKMRHITRVGRKVMSIVRFVHNEEAPTSLDTFEPFVIYSLNKKYRWLLSENMSPQGLESLQEPGSCVVVVERQFKGLRTALEAKIVHTHWYNMMMSRAKTVCHLDPEFSKNTCRGIGNKHVHVNRTPDVSYSIFKMPSNYAKIYVNKVESPDSLEHPVKPRKYFKFLRDEFEEFQDEKRNREEEIDEVLEKEQKYYNLMEHFVTKAKRKKALQYHGFVIV